MLPVPKEALCQLLFLLCVSVYINEVRSEGRVVCYYTNWSVYRPGTAKFNPQNINPYLCTHLIYAFGGFTKDNQMKPFDKYQDIEQGGYAKFTGLKTYNKLLKTMIAIGGWNEASSRFSPLVANPERRQKFIKNILKFLRQNHFDGIDLDWEYPAHREGGKQRDKENYAQFVQELRSEFERESEKTGRTRLLLTMAVPAGIEYVEKGYDIPKLNKYLDWFNILTYDFHSSHEPSVNHHAPLYSLEEESEYNYDSELNTDYSVKFYLNAGADRDKIVLGIPTYGRSFTLINEESTDIGAPAEAPGEQGDATREKGYLAYYEICQNIKEDPEWTVVQANPNAVGPYAYRRNQWVGYDDEAIVRKKAQYVVDNSLGGIMFWTIDNDDFRGICTGKPYPLIEAAKDAMLNSLGLGINEVSKSSAPQKPSHSRSRENSSLIRNRITTPEHKLTYAERKGSSKNVQPTPQTIRKRIQSITTSESANIKLTDIEGSSLYVGQRTTTPLPPTTPDPGTDFKCEDEGFFQHPRDCKKYYWCLDSGPSALGIVAHQFTCPSGLYFNPAADSCDFARNVPCKSKKAATAITSTTDRPTSPYNRITAATTRSSKFFRTTPRTTTTAVPAEEENAYDEEHENVHSPFAIPKGFDNGSEEDPQVIKELITLIRKVGGIDELEKHLLRKDDGTISIKEYSASSSSTLGFTTPSSISKSLYEKVLSKPNSLSSFRNNFTTSNILRNIHTTIRDSTHDDENSHSSDIKRSEVSDELSKYPSMLSGKNRQGPQSEGLDKSSDFNGFLKEKKKYITISRNRNTKLISADEEDDEENEPFDEMNSKSTSKPFTASSPVYSTIRRTKPLTTFVENVMEKDEKDTKVAGRSTYTSVNRSRAKDITTTELSEVSAAASKRYKHLERSHLTYSSIVPDDSVSPKEEKNYENMVHFPGVDIENTQTQKEISTNAQTNFGSVGPKNLINIEEPKRETLATLTTSTKETLLTTPLSLTEATTSDAILVTTNAPLTFITNPTTETLPNAENILKAPTTSHLNETNPDVSEDSSFLSSTPPSTMEYTIYIREPDNNFHLTATETTLYPTTGTIIGTDNLTRTVDSAYKEVNQVSKQRHKGLYNTRTRTFKTTSPKTSGTITNVAIETTPSSAIGTNTKKFLIVRRQPTLLNSSSQTKITSAVTTTDMPSTPSVQTLNDNFLSTVSSPRPFGFPIRRNRPIGTRGVTTEEISIPNDEVIVTKQKHNKTNTATKSPNKRYQFQHITTPTAVTELFVEQNGDSDANKTQVNLNDANEPEREIDTNIPKTTALTIKGNSTLAVTPLQRRIKVLKLKRRLVANINKTNTNMTLNAIASNVTNLNARYAEKQNPLKVRSNAIDLEVENSETLTKIDANNMQMPITAQTSPPLTKHVRKIIRKLIKPGNKNNIANANGTDCKQSGEQNATKFDFNRNTFLQLSSQDGESGNNEQVKNCDVLMGNVENEKLASRQSEGKLTIAKAAFRTNITSLLDFTRRKKLRLSESSKIIKNSDESENVRKFEDKEEKQEGAILVASEQEKEIADHFMIVKHGNDSIDPLLKLRYKIKQDLVKGNDEKIVLSTPIMPINSIKDEDELKNGDLLLKERNKIKEIFKYGLVEEALSDRLKANIYKSELDDTDYNQDQGVVKLNTPLIPNYKVKDDEMGTETTTENVKLQKTHAKVKTSLEKSNQNEKLINSSSKEVLFAKSSDISLHSDDLREDKENETLTDSKEMFAKGDMFEVDSSLSTRKVNLLKDKLEARRPYIVTTLHPTFPTSTKTVTTTKNRNEYIWLKNGSRNTTENFVLTTPEYDKSLGTNRGKILQNGQNSKEEDYREFDAHPVQSIKHRSQNLFDRIKCSVLKEYAAICKEQVSDVNEDGEQEEEDDLNIHLDENDSGSTQEDDKAIAKDHFFKYNFKGNRIPIGDTKPSINVVPTTKKSLSRVVNMPYRPSAQVTITPKKRNSRFKSTEKARVVNYPPDFSVPIPNIKVMANDFERKTALKPTKHAPFINTNIRAYERKYIGRSTEAPIDIGSDKNLLIDDQNTEIRNAHNKNIFDIEGEKHTPLKSNAIISLVTPNLNTQEPRQEKNIEFKSNDNQPSVKVFATATKTITSNTDTEKQEHKQLITRNNTGTSTHNTDDTNQSNTNNLNEIFSQDRFPSTSVPRPTLLHIFTLANGEPTTQNPLSSVYQVPPRVREESANAKHKVVEINRIIEVNSKEEKLKRKSKTNIIVPIEGSQTYKVESLPHIEQLGEISVAKYVHRVDGSDIKIEGRSTVTNYTPTEPTFSDISHSSPAANGEKRSGKELIPEVLREAIETSTISLEGLFDSSRKGKVLNPIESVIFTQQEADVNKSYDKELNSTTKLPSNHYNKPVPEIAQVSKQRTGNSDIFKSVSFNRTRENWELNSKEFETKKHALESTTTETEKFSYSMANEITTLAPDIFNTEAITVTSENTKVTIPTSASFAQYVRPILPLLRPESNESSPLVISIANLDKVVLSKVKKG